MSIPRPPRVAVIGGGIAGSLCALVLRSRGAVPVVIDRGKRQAGGRVAGGGQPDSGVQFLRATDPRLATVFAMLEREGLLAAWQGRFGVLGSRGGGFLPAEVVAATRVGSMAKVNGGGGGGGPGAAAATDSGDFCGFVNQSGPATYVGSPSMAVRCARILIRMQTIPLP